MWIRVSKIRSKCLCQACSAVFRHKSQITRTFRKNSSPRKIGIVIIPFFKLIFLCDAISSASQISDRGFIITFRKTCVQCTTETPNRHCGHRRSRFGYISTWQLNTWRSREISITVNGHTISVYSAEPRCKAQKIDRADGIVSLEGVNIHPAFLFYRVPFWPTTDLRCVKPIAVVVPPDFRIEVFGAEAVGEAGGGGAGGGDGFAEAVVGVAGGEDAGAAVHIFGDVAVGVGGGRRDLAGADFGEETAYPTGTLEAAAEVKAPEIMGDGSAGDHVMLVQERPAIVEEALVGNGGSRVRDLLADAAGTGIVGVGDDGGGVARSKQAVFTVPRENPSRAGGEHVAVVVVGRRRRIDRGVLVEHVGNIVRLDGAFNRLDSVSDWIIGVGAELVPGDPSGDKIAVSSSERTL